MHIMGKKGCSGLGWGHMLNMTCMDPGQCATAATAEDSDGVYTEQEDHVK